MKGLKRKARKTRVRAMSPERLKQFGEAWGRADIDALMEFMTDDCVYKASVGPDPGTTYVGREAVRKGFAEVLAYESGGEPKAGPVWVLGSRAVAEWSYIITRPDGRKVEIRGCDLFEFDGDKIRRKNAFRKAYP
ncbi:nuclear transport factor 2 family protein [bacterium]|nr:nuclear transport factor 2 family protein [bacterium]